MKNPHSFRTIGWILVSLLLLSTLSWYAWLFLKEQAFNLQQEEDVRITESDYTPDVEDADPRPQLTASPFHITTISVQKNSSLYTTLHKAGLYVSVIYKLLDACEKLYDLSSIAAGVTIQLRYEPDTEVLQEVFIEISPLLGILIQQEPHGEWIAEKMEKTPVIELVTLTGKIESSLWDSAAKAGLHAQGIYELTDIFAWQIDFDRQIKMGDTWSVVIEKMSLEGKFYDWGKIYAARYTLDENDYKAVLFSAHKESKRTYYSPEGESLEGMFLKSPLKFSRISSPFQKKRFHPILGISRPHNGVDYAAPTGTPIHVVADGRIVSIGWQNGGGNVIKIKHNSMYETAYKHMSRFGSGLHKNARVHQGEIIGYVGATGLATGPHLHFEFYENGQYMDPLGIKFPRKEALSIAQKAEFHKAAQKYLAMLETTQGLATTPASPR